MKIKKADRAEAFRPEGTKPRRRSKPVGMKHKKKHGPKASRVKGMHR